MGTQNNSNYTLILSKDSDILDLRKSIGPFRIIPNLC